jgi:hypothetical protein
MARPPFFVAFNATLQVPGKPEPDPDVLLVGDSGPDRIQHASTGTWYVKQGRLRPYDLYLKERAETPGANSGVSAERAGDVEQHPARPDAAATPRLTAVLVY